MARKVRGVGMKVLEEPDWDRHQLDFHGDMIELVGKVANEMEQKATERAPADNSRLRTSIRAQRIGPAAFAVGSDVLYAPFVEFGTGPSGLQSPQPGGVPSWYQHSRGKLKGPWPRHVKGWARRHGMDPGAVATAIREGVPEKGIPPGIKAQPFLRPAFLEVRAKLRRRGFLR